MAQVRDPGWGMSPDQIEMFYMRWREWMLVAAHRNSVVVMNPEHQGFIADLLERLQEDPWWKLRVELEAVVMFDERVPRDDMLFSTGEGKLMTPRELVGRTGFGRMNAKAPNRDGVMPWSEAKPDADARPIQPDPGTGGRPHDD